MNPNDPAFKIAQAIRDVAKSTSDAVAIGAAHYALMMCVGTAAQMHPADTVAMAKEVHELIKRHTTAAHSKRKVIEA